MDNPLIKCPPCLSNETCLLCGSTGQVLRSCAVEYELTRDNAYYDDGYDDWLLELRDAHHA